MGQWPSAVLKPPERGKGQVAAVFWWMLFALAVVGILGGVGRSLKEYAEPSGFERVGLTIEPTVGACFGIMPRSRAATAQWPESIDSTTGGCLTRIGDLAVIQSTPQAAVAERLDGPEGSKVEVELAPSPDAPAITASFRREPVGDWLEIGVLIVRTIVSVLFVAVAFALRRRRSTDPISLRISFAFVLIAQINPAIENYWRSVEGSGLSYLAGIVGILMLVAAFPAFPDGVYAPRWARWLRVALPVGVVVAAFTSLLVSDVLAGLFVVILFVISLVLLVLRYFRMPRGREKQQVKWAVGGMAAGLLLASVGLLVSEPRGLLESDPQLFHLQMAAVDLLTTLGLGLLPVGVGISLLEYRLNDADAVAGKSLGYAIVTVVVAVVWAIVQSVVSDLAKSWAGSPAATTAITTVIAALVITPTRAYVLAWTENKFQPALVHLRKLPEKLDRWQTCQTPDELAQATLADLVNGIGAAYAVILGDDGREWRVLAAHGMEPDEARAQLAAERPADRSQDPFPIRRELTDQIGQPDLLAIGPRSDGASFSRDEKAAIALVLEPLSNALQAAALRERHVLKVENSLAGIDQRLGRLEVELAPVVKEAASRRSPKGSPEADRSSPT